MNGLVVSKKIKSCSPWRMMWKKVAIMTDATLWRVMPDQHMAGRLTVALIDGRLNCWQKRNVDYRTCRLLSFPRQHAKFLHFFLVFRAFLFNFLLSLCKSSRFLSWESCVMNDFSGMSDNQYFRVFPFNPSINQPLQLLLADIAMVSIYGLVGEILRQPWWIFQSGLHCLRRTWEGTEAKLID